MGIFLKRVFVSDMNAICKTQKTREAAIHPNRSSPNWSLRESSPHVLITGVTHHSLRVSPWNPTAPREPVTSPAKHVTPSPLGLWDEKQKSQSPILGTEARGGATPFPVVGKHPELREFPWPGTRAFPGTMHKRDSRGSRTSD